MSSSGASVHPAPAFALDFDPTLLFTESSVDHDWDKILGDLDLEVQTTDQHPSHIVQRTVAPDPSLQPTASDAGGLRELFGVQQGWGLQQPPQHDKHAAQQLQQQQQQQLQEPSPMVLPPQQPQQTSQQLPQQVLEQHPHQKQQNGPGLGVVYQLPSPYMQPLSALPAGMPLLQGLPGFKPQQAAVVTGIPPANGFLHLQQQQQLLQLQMQQQQQLQLQLLQQQQVAANAAPMFTFSALPVNSQLQQAAVSMPPTPAAAAAAAAATPASMAGLYMLPAGWQYMQQQQQQAAALGAVSAAGVMGLGLVPGSISPAAAAQAASSSGGTVLASPSAGTSAAAAAGGSAVTAKGRGAGGRSSKPVAPGMEKPKGPSQRFRERQKATISSLEQELSAKLAELQVLSAENQMLKLRSAVLEAVTSGREYHMKVIKEHGPPTFEMASDASPHSPHAHTTWDSCQQQPPAGSDSASEHLPGSTAAAAAHSSQTGGSGSSSTSGTAAATGAFGTDASSLPLPLRPGAAVQRDGLTGPTPHAACDPFDDMQNRSIRCIRQMTADEIITHWRQFLADVSDELLTADEQEEQQRLADFQLGRGCSQQHDQAAAAAGKQQQQQAVAADTEEPEDSGEFTMSRVCRWCGCTNNDGLHLEEGCRGATDDRAASADVAQPSVLPAAEKAAGSSMTDARLVELVEKYSYMTKFVALLNPGVLYSLFGRNLDTGEAAAYTDEHWRNVVARLHLTKQQITYILACAELYFSSLSGIMAERQALHSALSQADGGLSECQRRLLGIDGTVDQLALLDRLSSSLKKEHVLRIMLNCFVWGRILTACQFAKTAVYSHPFFPDVHAMVCVLYEDHWKASPDCQNGKVFPHRIAAAKAALAQRPTPMATA